jgi:hypothetical protein
MPSGQGLIAAKWAMPEAPADLSPEEAASALRRIARAWELDRSDAMALIRMSAADLSTIEWTDERLARITYLTELESALPRLDPRGGIPRWLSTSKPGPFFGDQSPLQMLKGSTQDMAALLREVRAWTERR